MTFLPSSIVYLNGKNGSGKTSLLQILSGIKTPTEGKITFSKESLPISFLKKPYSTYIGHNLAIKPELTVLENIKFWAKLYHSEILINAAISYFQLQSVLDRCCFELSEGIQKKVALSRLIACSSKLWLLDEAETNLDTENKEILTNLILSHAHNGGIVFLTSHEKPTIKTAQTINLNEFRPE